MQSLESTLMNNQSQQVFEGLVLSNVTNQNTPTLSPHSSQKSYQPHHPNKQDPLSKESSMHTSHNTSNHLQQENQILKTQIEVLKQALLEICKDSKISGQIEPLLTQVKGENPQAEKQLYNFINQLQQTQSQLLQQQQQIQQQLLTQHHTPTKLSSPSKKSQPKQSRENFGFLPYGENSILRESPTAKYSQGSSVKKQQASSNRRRRCDRVNATPSNNQIQAIQHQFPISNYLESRFTVTPTSTNSRGIIQEIALQVCESKKNLRQEEGYTSRIKELDMEDNKIVQSPSIKLRQESSQLQISGINKEERCSIDQESGQQQSTLKKDSSQIQLKYAKILEELENASNQRQVMNEEEEEQLQLKGEQREKNNNSNEQTQEKQEDEYEEDDARNSYNDISIQTPQKLESQILNNTQQCQQQEEGDSLTNQKKRSYSTGYTKIFHMRNKKSSQHEQKQFYEQELNQLKNELDLFNKEEEKLLSILESSSQTCSLRESTNLNINPSYDINQSKVNELEQMTTEKNFQQLEQNIGDLSIVQTDQTQSPGKQNVNLRESTLNMQQILANENKEENVEDRVTEVNNQEKQSDQTVQVLDQVKEEDLKEIIVEDVEKCKEEEKEEQLIEEPEIVKEHLQTLSHQEMLQNLAEVTQYLNTQDDGEEDDLGFIKPVKIQSPTGITEEYSKEDQQESNQDYQSLKEEVKQTNEKTNISNQHQKLIKQREDSNGYEPFPRNTTPQITKKMASQITPIRQRPQQNQATSADRQQLKKFSSKKSQNKRESIGTTEQQQQQEIDKQNNIEGQNIVQDNSYQQNQQQLTSSKRSSGCTSQSNFHRMQKGFLSNQKQRGINIQNYVPIGSNSKRKTSMKKDNLPNGKSPQQTSIYKIFKNMSNNASPLKQIMKSERRYEQCQQNEEGEDIDDDIYQEENMSREQKLLSIEQLSKQQSLMKGLKQQELPDSDGELEDLKQKNNESKNIIDKQQNQEKKEVHSRKKSNEYQDLLNSGNYYGVYSKEKSEELKNQRYESIKKAEELLSQFIVQKSQRPYFINNILTRPLQIPSSTQSASGQSHRKEEKSYCYTPNKEEEELENLEKEKRYISDNIRITEDDYKTFIVDTSGKIIEEDLRIQGHLFDKIFYNQSYNFVKESFGKNPNEVSFQQNQQIEGGGTQLCQVNFVPTSIKSSGGHSRSSSSRLQQQNFLNIEIPSLLRSPPKNQVEHSIVYEQTWGNSEKDEKNKIYKIARRSSLNQVSTQMTIDSDSRKETIHTQQYQEPTPEKKKIQGNYYDFQSRNFGNTRRKSHELCKNRGGIFSQQKKSTVIKMKRLDDVSPNYSQNTQLNQNSSHTAFQKFNLGANQTEKNGKGQHKNAETTIVYSAVEEGNCIVQQMINNGISQKIFNQTFVDPEFFYEKRSKSVIKRRDELIKKKEEQNRSKIEAKYQKIDQIRQTRNQRLQGVVQNHLQTQGQQQNRSQNRESKVQKGGQHSRCKYGGEKGVQMLSYYNQPNRSDEEEAYLEITASKAAFDSNYMSNIEKKHNLVVETQKPIQEKSNNNITTTITPLSIQPLINTNGSHLQNPSFQTTNCKTSLLISECSSFRQAPSQFDQQQYLQQQQQMSTIDQKEVKQFSKSQNKNSHCNLAYKKQQQQQQSLKQNIINRTLRMEGAVGGGQCQSKGRHTQNEMSNIYLKKMQSSTIDVSAYNDNSKSGTLGTTLHSSSSFTCNKNNSQYSNKSGLGTSQMSQSNTQNTSTKSHNHQGAIIINKKYCLKQKDQQKLMNSSRSNKKLLSESIHQAPQSYYNSKKTTVSTTSNNQQSIIVESVQPIQVLEQLNVCNNCQRLISKGISTDFCLQHFEAPSYRE